MNELETNIRTLAAKQLEEAAERYYPGSTGTSHDPHDHAIAAAFRAEAARLRQAS
jgi:hypothetical protein